MGKTSELTWRNKDISPENYRRKGNWNNWKKIKIHLIELFLVHNMKKQQPRETRNARMNYLVSKISVQMKSVLMDFTPENLVW